jgi:hypothetical protein
MTAATTPIIRSQHRRSFFVLYWRVRHRLKRIGRAAAYAAGTLSAPQAQDIIEDCELVAERFALMTLATDHVMDMAVETYGDKAVLLKPYPRDACSYVASKWDLSADDYWYPRDWALSTAVRAARQDGIELSSEADGEL